jgi:enoyl-CoA hydratase
MAETRKFEALQLQREAAVATISLDRPKALNAINGTMLNELATAFSQLAADSEIRAILLTGFGDRAFAAGADIRELAATDTASGLEISEQGQRVCAQIERSGKPVIASVNGVALGGGCELALACCFRLASETAKLGLPEARLGLIPGFGGILRLVRLVGRGAAMRLLLTAQTVDAGEALRIGLVDEVVPSADLTNRAYSIAHEIAALAPLAVAGMLEAVRYQESLLSADEILEGERNIFARLCGTADKREGLVAFLEKRLPVWRGQ